ncbi:hypothetical protein F7725_009095 [Dissostichus mawsoni]|uniref:Uncharacterized protein n=1 Tax=Dissostichus mawsoni TaxID=36200 RepID=A0A7J5Z6H5_DISMA|nr:hypothetical protein F7725_009095 [Dissostichus mawsoni]
MRWWQIFIFYFGPMRAFIETEQQQKNKNKGDLFVCLYATIIYPRVKEYRVLYILGTISSFSVCTKVKQWPVRCFG